MKENYFNAGPDCNRLIPWRKKCCPGQLIGPPQKPFYDHVRGCNYIDKIAPELNSVARKKDIEALREQINKLNQKLDVLISSLSKKAELKNEPAKAKA